MKSNKIEIDIKAIKEKLRFVQVKSFPEIRYLNNRCFLTAYGQHLEQLEITERSILDIYKKLCDRALQYGDWNNSCNIDEFLLDDNWFQIDLTKADTLDFMKYPCLIRIFYKEGNESHICFVNDWQIFDEANNPLLNEWDNVEFYVQEELWDEFEGGNND